MGDGARCGGPAALARAVRLGEAGRTMTAAESTDLTGQFLIAMPGMGDPRFEKSVVLLCAHSPEGAMGLIVNKPAPGASLDDLMTQLGIAPVPERLQRAVLFGGPVELGRGFVLHSSDYRAEGSTLVVDPSFSMTGTLDVLRDMSAGGGPGVALLALGYAGWGPGQLETELGRNDWLTAAAHPRIVFDLPNAAKWEAALAVLGIDPLFLSPDAGRA
jgi:putative transcriptional regulator